MKGFVVLAFQAKIPGQVIVYHTLWYVLNDLWLTFDYLLAVSKISEMGKFRGMEFAFFLSFTILNLLD